MEDPERKDDPLRFKNGEASPGLPDGLRSEGKASNGLCQMHRKMGSMACGGGDGGVGRGAVYQWRREEQRAVDFVTKYP